MSISNRARWAATLRQIDPTTVTREHMVNPKQVAEMAASFGERTLDPVLVVERSSEEGQDRFRALDGHHRIATAIQLGHPTIDAWVISEADLAAILQQSDALGPFDGQLPNDLCRLRKFIQCGEIDANHIPGAGRCEADGPDDDS
jgi:hypothetical protein